MISPQEKELPIKIIASFECCQPNISKVLKYCNASIKKENSNTEIAVINTFTLKNELTKQ
jgi:hypothetical protein